MYYGYEVYKLHDGEINRTNPFWEEMPPGASSGVLGSGSSS